jgi:hypothetical protein
VLPELVYRIYKHYIFFKLLHTITEVRAGASVTSLTFITMRSISNDDDSNHREGRKGRGCVYASEGMVMQFDVGPTFPTRHCNSAVGKTEKPHNMILCTL